MDIKDYKFNVGDEVITIDGRRGKIVDICTCSQCVERGFYEPTWIADNDSSKDYITIGTAICGFPGYYQIGEYRFNDLDKSKVLHDIASYENELKRLRNQLKVIEDIEGAEMKCDYCKNGTYRKPIHQYDGTLVRKVNFCDECGRDLRHL